jgi:hypothetical protein
MKLPITNTVGNQYWYQKGLFHRVSGPAVISSGGHQSWWKNDRLHREDGPATVWSDGYKEWYLRGKRIKRENEHELT